MKNKLILLLALIIACLSFDCTKLFAQSTQTPIVVEFQEAGGSNILTTLPLFDTDITPNARITTYRNLVYQVTIHEIDRGTHIEVNGELERLVEGNSSLTVRISFPFSGKSWKWFSGLEEVKDIKPGLIYTDTVGIRTLSPRDGAFNGKTLAEGGYGDLVGKGTMSFYPLTAISIDSQGQALGIDLTIPIVYRFSADANKGLVAEFDVSTSPLTEKFPNRAFFKLSKFSFNPKWGMRSALKKFYSIYPESFKKRVVNEGIWLPFTALRSINKWEDFGFAYHETSAGTSDTKDGKRIPTIVSDKGTGVLSFQYTEPWDVQLPITTMDIPYDTLISDKILPERQREYIRNSATWDKNGQWQARRLKTPWFKSGWAVSITTNADPGLPGFNRHQYVLQNEVTPAKKLNVDGVYFDSMEWNWHHDLNYRQDHFKFTDFPLTFSSNVGKPAIWNFVSEFESMKTISDEMHAQGKLSMGNGHDWNPFAASNLDLFGAELSWYSEDSHNTKALDFKRAISFQKPIVFLLNRGFNDTLFTKEPFKGYELYFEKMMAYGFFPSFFSTNASSDPYWKDPIKVENGRPFFKKYIPIIKQISAAGWEPVTGASINVRNVKIERFGSGKDIYFTVKNNDELKDAQLIMSVDINELGLNQLYSAQELIEGRTLKVETSKIYLTVPAGRTKVIHVKTLPK
ncbi:MAG: hypothetical protein V4721_15915 [Bacteroidota bacterium]